MAYILCIETASVICSISLQKDNEMIGLGENTEGNAHASQITILIDSVLRNAGLTVKELDAVAVSKGPGSYTGLRVGVSTAKGLCYALGIPLIAINTLESLAWHFMEQRPDIKPGDEALLVPMLDARRMEAYCAVFDTRINIIRPTMALIINGDSFSDLPSGSATYFFGSGSGKCSGVIGRAGAHYTPEIQCSASGMRIPAYRAFVSGQFEDLAYFEPFYLKDFVGTQKKN